MTVAATILLRGDGSGPAEAHLHTELRSRDLELIERSWAPERAAIVARLRRASVDPARWPQSLHWDWSRKAPQLNLLAVSACAIECGDQWQAAMMTKTAPYLARSETDRGKPLVYVDFLEVAPWNWRLAEIDQQPRFKLAGSVLLRHAVQQSLREGFHGRVGLHSLPQAEGYYRDCGMQAMAAANDPQGLRWFEFTRQAAEFFLEGRIP